MNTPSHLIINAALRKGLMQNRSFQIPRSAFLLGAVLPDIPLFLLWLGGYVYYAYLLGDASITLMDPRFNELFFNNPFWIAAHNLLHAPLLLLAALAILWRFRAQPASKGGWWFWFVAGCLVHTALDIPTHQNDGPLLFFPFEWTIRFYSPISYWNPQYYGREFAIFELGLNLVLLAYLLVPWLWGRFRRQRIRRDRIAKEP